ncbi:hypothetical protein V1292_002976 [Bradyrhizobium sp. AZCC 1719]
MATTIAEVPYIVPVRISPLRPPVPIIGPLKKSLKSSGVGAKINTMTNEKTATIEQASVVKIRKMLSRPLTGAVPSRGSRSLDSDIVRLPPFGKLERTATSAFGPFAADRPRSKPQPKVTEISNDSLSPNLQMLNRQVVAHLRHERSRSATSALAGRTEVRRWAVGSTNDPQWTCRSVRLVCASRCRPDMAKQTATPAQLTIA